MKIIETIFVYIVTIMIMYFWLILCEIDKTVVKTGNEDINIITWVGVLLIVIGKVLYIIKKKD